MPCQTECLMGLHRLMVKATVRKTVVPGSIPGAPWLIVFVGLWGRKHLVRLPDCLSGEASSILVVPVLES